TNPARSNTAPHRLIPVFPNPKPPTIPVVSNDNPHSLVSHGHGAA
uniref:Uncharacterized protein n=1 Tax=Aegilops tauschii subsp. strangulata TaxID=200361 RepID=A0A452YTH3_AEGTS